MNKPSARTRYQVSGMDCASCAAKIDTAVRRIEGVEDVTVSVSNQSMSVVHQKSVPTEAIVRQISKLGYQVTPADDAVWQQPVARARHDHEEAPSHEAHSHEADIRLETSGEPWWLSKRAFLTLASAAALIAAY